MFIVALFIVNPNWKQPKWHSKNEWINYGLTLYPGILFSNNKK